MAGMHNMLMGTGSITLDVQTITSKYVQISGGDPKSPTTTDYYGYDSLIPGSTITDGTSNIYGGASLSIFWSSDFGLNIVVNGDRSNSGWSAVRIYHPFSDTTNTYNRASFNFIPLNPGVTTVTQWFLSTANLFSNITDGQNTYQISFLG